MRSTLLCLSVLACTGDTDSVPQPGAASDSDVPSSPFALSLPDAFPTTHEALADRCDLELPDTHECTNGSPEVRWVRAPNTTQSFVLIFDDPDAGDFPHWALWDIPGDTNQLPADASGQSVRPNLPEGVKELTNGFGWDGYLGSCPPTPHVYRWRLWAVDDTFSFVPPTNGTALDTFAALEAAAEASALDVTEACHTYGPAVSPP